VSVCGVTAGRMPGMSVTATMPLSGMTTSVTVPGVAAAKSSKRHGRETGCSKYQ
jgi:hypothetical protein